jgi:hypothetical protein
MVLSSLNLDREQVEAERNHLTKRATYLISDWKMGSTRERMINNLDASERFVILADNSTYLFLSISQQDDGVIHVVSRTSLSNKRPSSIETVRMLAHASDTVDRTYFRQLQGRGYLSIFFSRSVIVQLPISRLLPFPNVCLPRSEWLNHQCSHLLCQWAR